MPVHVFTQSFSTTRRMTGAQALTSALLSMGTKCVFGIPGAQANELWDEFKNRGLGYLLVSHEYSAAAMADGYARSTGQAGVLCIVAGPGVTNSLTGIGEALLDSVPLVCLVTDIARGEKYRPFQVHCLPHVSLLAPVTKEVVEVTRVEDICVAVRRAFRVALGGEPGPVAVIVPYNLLIESGRCRLRAPEPVCLPLDKEASARALALLHDRRFRVGIYAGLGCMDHSESLVQLAEALQAPVATSISGKGSFPEDHALSVGWGYGPQASPVAQQIFRTVDLVLAVGVKYAEVSTGFYSQPRLPHLIHVDINESNLGRVMPTDVSVHADAGRFLGRLLEDVDRLRRPPDRQLLERIAVLKERLAAEHQKVYAHNGVDPVALFRALDRLRHPDGMLFVDVTISEMWAFEIFTIRQPRTFFNPSNNQSMGWSIPAALGAQRAYPGKQVCTITGDGAFLVSGLEFSTAARDNLPVKFFILDDHAYSFMQMLQMSAYRRTTATMLARLDYQALARGLGMNYQEIHTIKDIDSGLRAALSHEGPVLTHVTVDHGRRPMRWLRAVGRRFRRELSARQKLRFLARLSMRSCTPPLNDD
jgi:acetolactate synthase-1/2/3 large subunit